MALNKFMHPENIYKDRKPDFKTLAIKYPEFRKHAVQDLKGNVHLDFKKPECLRVLSWALLKEDFGLNVEIPDERLIPTIPLRLNYLLWLKDLLGKKSDVLSGIDIGAGAVCVYPLLGAKQWNWQFTATETDSLNFEYATRNVENNGLQHLVRVIKVSEDSSLCDLLKDSDTSYDFTMCNPPFFSSNLEAWGHSSSRKPDRPEANSVNTACESESICHGGEVEFVKRMITESLQLKNRVRLFTSMVGKKSSLTTLKQELQKNGITKFGITEFCQGRTMRWGLGWTFSEEDVVFPPAPSKVHKKAMKPKQPLTWDLPRKMSQIPDLQYTVPFLGSKVMTILDELKIVYEPQSSGAEKVHIQMAAQENTWSHQRRKRRQQQRQAEQRPEDGPQAINKKSRSQHGEIGNTLLSEEDCKGTNEKGCPQNPSHLSDVDGTNSKAEPDHSLCDLPVIQTGDDVLNSSVSLDDLSEYLFKAQLMVVKCNDAIQLQLVWDDGENVEFLHQVLQFFKNRFK